MSRGGPWAKVLETAGMAGPLRQAGQGAQRLLFNPRALPLSARLYFYFLFRVFVPFLALIGWLNQCLTGLKMVRWLVAFSCPPFIEDPCSRAGVGGIMMRNNIRPSCANDRDTDRT